MNKTLDNLVFAAAEIVVDHLEEGRKQTSTSFSNSLDLLRLAVKARRENEIAEPEPPPPDFEDMLRRGVDPDWRKK